MFKILVVEDWEIAPEIYKTYFPLGCEILSASTVEQAIDLIISRQPHVILLDIHLKNNESGYEVLDFIKENNIVPYCRVAVTTSLTGSDNAQIGIERGADHYFIKPLNPPDVIRWVFRQLGNIAVEMHQGKY